MLKNCINLMGLVSHKEPILTQKRGIAGASFSLEISVQFGDISLGSQLNDVSVKIIHAGGKIELYQDVIPASHVMEKYPGMCVALPEVFRKPYESILSPEEDLVPGRKYYVVPSSTASKLKRKYQETMKAIEAAAGKETKLDVKTLKAIEAAAGKETKLDVKTLKAKEAAAEEETKLDVKTLKAKEAAAEEGMTLDTGTKVRAGEGSMEEPICSAKDFYTSNRWSRSSTRKRGIKKQPFVPPIPIPRPRMLRSMTWEPSLSSVQELSP